jgi:hypothetical protein
VNPTTILWQLRGSFALYTAVQARRPQGPTGGLH